MKLRCAKCAHTWEVGIKDGQRLILCPNCGTLTPVESAANQTMAGGYQFGQLMAVPFALESEQETRAPRTIDRPPPPKEKRAAPATTNPVLLEVDLANARELQQTHGEERSREVLAIFERVARFEIARFHGREIEGGRKFLLAFERPIEAAAYALNLIDTLRNVAREVGLDFAPRAGIHVAAVKIRAASTADVARGAAACAIEGEGKDSAGLLRRVAMPNQILMTREAWDRARARAAGNEAIPHGTQWMKHGSFRIEGFPAPVEVCEVGRVGLAPLVSPLQSGKGDAQQTATGATTAKWRVALQVGAANLLQNVGGGGGSIRIAGVEVPENLKDRPREEQLAGQPFLNYQLDRIVDSDEDSVTYHARDTDHERDVNLKVLRTKHNGSIKKLTRFIREGLSASQVVHPNWIEAWATGEHGGFHYIAYERIQGGSLRELVESTGRIKVNTALGYIVQAARGVKVAHDRGVIHRNISPDTLLLSSGGTVKVAELTLAKLEGDQKPAGKGDDQLIMGGGMANITTPGMALGDPEFIAPEQAADASTVDKRADQYSLGAVLYYLLAGRPPHEGVNAVEVVSNRSKAPYPPVGKLVRDAPPQLVAVIDKLLMRKPEDRFGETWQVVAALEDVLGIEHSREGSLPSRGNERAAMAAPASVDSGPSTLGLGPDPYAALRDHVRAYYAAPFQKVRKAALWAFFLVVPLATIGLTMWLKDFQTPMTGLALLFLPIAWSVAIDGLLNRTPLFLQLRMTFLRMGVGGWVTLIIGLLFGGVMAWAMGVLFHWLGVAVVSLIIALAYELGIALPLKMQRSGIVHTANEEVRRLRETGLSEDRIREGLFGVCEKHWEEFFEALFGYEAMLSARTRYVVFGKGGRRPRFGSWRDPLYRWAKNVEAGRRRAMQESQLAKAEALRLKELGQADADAERKARREAHRVIEQEQKRAKKDRRAAAPAAFDAEMPMDAPIGTGMGLMRGSQYYHGVGSSPVRTILNGASSLVGMIVLACFLIPTVAPKAGIALPQQVVDFLKDYYTWGWGGTFKALLIAGLLMKNTVGRRYLPPICSLLGAVLLVFTVPIVQVVAQPQFDLTMARFAGFALMLMGMGVGGFRRFLSPMGFMPV